MTTGRMMGTLALAVAIGGACVDWVPYRPRSAVFGDYRVAFEATVTTLRASGYNTVEFDPARYFVRVQSRVDGDYVGSTSYSGFRFPTNGTTMVTPRISWISFQVFSNGQVQAIASGYHVRDDEAVIDERVLAEIDGLMRGIAENARRLGGAATATAAAAPAGPNPAPPAASPPTNGVPAPAPETR